MSDTYHKPVLLEECIEGLAVQAGGVYVDATFGGGGHSKAILEKLHEGGKLFAFDQDEDAKANAARMAGRSFTFIGANFRYLRQYLRMHNVKAIDGLLADLGISSHQIDEASRGFSTRFDAELDMRMDRKSGKSAKTVINEYSEGDLQRVLGNFGEVRNAKTLARAIAAARITGPIETVSDLKAVLDKFAQRGKENKYYAQVFQAVRIEVNEELKALASLLEQSAGLIRPEGRIVILSYHSLEDRMVKNFLNSGNVEGELEKDLYGNVIKPFQAMVRKPIMPSEEEIKMNNRARSARLRIGQKI